MISLVAYAFAISRVEKPPATELFGTWKARFHIEEVPDIDTNRFHKASIKLSKNGKFTFHIESRVMVNILEDDAGTYKFDGKVLRLTGTSKTLTDDGYKKETYAATIDYKLRFADGKLILADAGVWTSKELKMKVVFSRAPVTPKPRAKPARP